MGLALCLFWNCHGYLSWVCTSNIQISIMNARLNITREIVLGVRNVSLTLCYMILYSAYLLF